MRIRTNIFASFLEKSNVNGIMAQELQDAR